jgi:RNA polymerase sigma factor (sigma-70 family)
LIERAQRGDIGAYEELVRTHQAVAFRVAYAITGSGAEAEDAAQEAFVKAYAALARFQPDRPFRPWIVRIAANEARNRRLAAGRRATLSLDDAATHALAAPERPLDELAAERERLEALLAAVDRLRPDDREVIVLRYALELNEAEMAAALDCARGTVKSRLSRALERLRRALAQEAAFDG